MAQGREEGKESRRNEGARGGGGETGQGNWTAQERGREDLFGRDPPLPLKLRIPMGRKKKRGGKEGGRDRQRRMARSSGKRGTDRMAMKKEA